MHKNPYYDFTIKIAIFAGILAGETLGGIEVIRIGNGRLCKDYETIYPNCHLRGIVWKIYIAA